MISVYWKRKERSLILKWTHLKLIKQKRFISTLCKHILAKSPLALLNPINLREIPDSWQKSFHNLLQKFVNGKLVTSFLVDDANKEFQKFISNVARENKALFRNHYINSRNLGKFYVQYLKDSIQYKYFALVLKIFLTFFLERWVLSVGSVWTRS